MRTVTVNVTERDIRLGETKNCFGCPVARAVRRTLRVEWCRVQSMIEFPLKEDPACQLMVRVPDDIRQWIRNFDRRSRHVFPFSFKLSFDPDVEIAQ